MMPTYILIDIIFSFIIYTLLTCFLSLLMAFIFMLEINCYVIFDFVILFKF